MNPIERNAIIILKSLIESETKQADGNRINSLTGLPPTEINDAIAYLNDLKAVEVIRFIGSAPYDFGLVTVNSRGRFLYNDLLEKGVIDTSHKNFVDSEVSLKWNQEANPESKNNITSVDPFTNAKPNKEDEAKDSLSGEQSNQSVQRPTPNGPSETEQSGEVEPPCKPLAIDPFAIPDRTGQKDLLGFTVYAQAIADFIINDKTEKPIAIGIDAAWGMGKTTLMEMICWELISREPMGVRWCGKCARCKRSRESEDADAFSNGYFAGDEAGAYIKVNQVRQGIPGRLITVWFNAWKYDREDSLWAALTLEILRRIRQHLSLRDQFNMRLKLNLARFDWDQVIESLCKAAPFALIVFIVALIISLISYAWTTLSLGDVVAKAFQNSRFALLLAMIPLLVITFRDFYKRMVGPFDLNISKYLREPNYQERIGFLSQFEDDFCKVIDIATENGTKTLVIFIDDLDRCSPPKPAEIIEAINILLDSQHCVFVIGMDGKAVASSIEAKYIDLKDYLEKSGDSTGASLGQRFLDKIIQINFRIPTVGLESIREFSKQILPLSAVPIGLGGDDTVKISEEIKTAEMQVEVFAENFDNYSEVNGAIYSALPYLQSNPRRIKRFHNSFRLMALIANRRRLLEQGIIRLDLLAKWVIIVTRWPDMIDTLETNSHFISQLKDAQEFKRKISTEGVKGPIDIRSENEKLDALLLDPKIRRMVDEIDFIELVNLFQGQLPNYIHLAEVT